MTASGRVPKTVSPAVVRGLPPAVHEGYVQAVAASLRPVFVVAAIVSVFSFFLTWLLFWHVVLFLLPTGATVLIARTDAHSAKLLTSDVDPRDREFCTGERTPEGFYRLRGELDCAIARAIAYAPFADLLWCETSTPDLAEAKKFAESVREVAPNKLLAYNCSPSFNWRKHLDASTIAKFQRELGAMGYKFQFVTLAGFHSLNHGMFDLASRYRERGMAAYAELQSAEFAAEADGYTATRHQREVGTGYFDVVSEIVSGGTSSTLALGESTEMKQF